MRFANCKAVALPLSTLTLIWASAAAADPPRLKGSYGFTGEAGCLIAPGYAGNPNGPPIPNPTPGVALPNSGFQPDLRPNDVLTGVTASISSTFAVEGIRTFNGDGTGIVRATVIYSVGRPTPGPGGYPHFPPSAASADFSFSFTYTVNPDGSWTSAMVPGSYNQIELTGPRAGQTSTVDAIPPITGLVSQDGKTLIGAHLTTAVETRTYSNGDVDPQICHRSQVFIKLNDDDHDRDH